MKSTKNISSNFKPGSKIQESGTRNQEPGALSPMTFASEAKWFAFYTKPRAEKRVYHGLMEQNYEAYLPLIKTLRQWSDRKKWVEVPLISSYIFVKIRESEIQNALKVYGILRYISFEGKPASIPNQQIDNLRLLINSEENIEVTGDNLKPGDPVEVTHGALQGLRGELVKIRNKSKVVVRIDKIDLNLIIDIQKAFLRKIR